MLRRPKHSTTEVVEPKEEKRYYIYFSFPYMPSHGHVYLYLYHSLMTEVLFDPQKLELDLAPQF